MDREFESHVAKICKKKKKVFEQVGEFKRKMKLFAFKTHE